jgi:predicted dienelactone hydrolase
MNSDRTPLPPSWFEKNVGGIVRGLVVICVLLLVADLVFHFVGHKHVHFDWEAWPGLYAAAGFVSYVGLVLTAKQLRKLLMRPEDHYGEAPLLPLGHPAGPDADPDGDTRAVDADSDDRDPRDHAGDAVARTEEEE